ncbi:MAG: hypothetical protein IJ204_08780 [Paludibacteraceae bacterium]|nr:hypothetical protein [Paludibacteraceae bacterium]
MAYVEWSAGIDSVSGALAKPGKSGQHSCDKMLLGTHRVAETESNQCTRIYLRKKFKRSTPVTAKEQAQREKFGAICSAVTARRKDLSKIAADTEAFLAQRETGRKTMHSYLFSLEKIAYEEAHNG